MQTEENDGGGKSVILIAGDNLDKVPKSHRKLVTASIREVYVDPPAHFNRIADVCPFPQMAAWLRVLLEEGDWELALHQGDPKQWTSAGFNWRSSKVYGAEISPSIGTAPAALPTALQSYYSLVDEIRWMDFGNAGGLDGSGSPPPITTFGSEFHGTSVEPAKTFVFGWSPGGDMLIYTQDGRGGWLCHENGKVHLFGTIEDTLEWVFGELLANRLPDFDYNWA